MSLKFLPYCRHSIDRSDVNAVAAALRSDYLTTGPQIERFERKFARVVGARDAVAVNSGTAALHTALVGAGVGPGDEVITTPYSFVATANTILHLGAVPVFADIRPEGFNIDPDQIETKIRRKTKAILPVHFAGEPSDLGRIKPICRTHRLKLIEDAAHALGAVCRHRPVGSIGDFTTFSFHPAKHITTGEGGMVATSSASRASAMRQFRNHGMSADVNLRRKKNTWKYDVTRPGYNYRLSDIQCALGISQLDRLRAFLKGRRRIALSYLSLLKDVDEIVLPAPPRDPGTVHAWHLFVIRLRSGRDAIFHDLRRRGIGVNVHYSPIHLFAFYRKKFGYRPGDFPNAERAARESLTLPLFPSMKQADVQRVVVALKESILRVRSR